MKPSLALACLLLLAAPACRTKVQRREASVEAPPPALAQATAAWEVVARGRVVGVVVEFDAVDGDRRFFSVRNPAQQELGMVDAHGRWWRYRPHEEEAEWLGTGTVIQGAGAILGLETEPEAYEVGLETLPRESEVPKR